MAANNTHLQLYVCTLSLLLITTTLSQSQKRFFKICISVTYTAASCVWVPTSISFCSFSSLPWTLETISTQLARNSSSKPCTPKLKFTTCHKRVYEIGVRITYKLGTHHANGLQIIQGKYYMGWVFILKLNFSSVLWVIYLSNFYLLCKLTTPLDPFSLANLTFALFTLYTSLKVALWVPWICHFFFQTELACKNIRLMINFLKWVGWFGLTFSYWQQLF